MSGSNNAIDLIYDGETTLVNMINQSNGTSYAVNDLIVGNPTSSADVDYNTDIDVTIKKEALPPDTVPAEEVGVLIPLHYNRLDLGRLFRNKQLTLRFAEGETINATTIATKISNEVKVVFDAMDLEPITFNTENLPANVLVRASADSLRFVGQFGVDVAAPIAQDYTIITEPELAAGVSPAPVALKSDGTLLAGTGNPAGKMLSATNGELELAIGARRFKDLLLVDPEDGNYTIVVGEQHDWNFPHSFALVNKKNGKVLTDLYDINLKITAVEGGGVLNFRLVREYGKLVFRDAANNLTISSGYVAEDQSVYQDIQRVSSYLASLGSLTLNDAGSPLGVFNFEVTAKRLGDEPQDDLILDFTVEVVKEAVVVPPPQARMASFSEPVEVPTAEVVDDADSEIVSEEPAAEEQEEVDAVEEVAAPAEQEDAVEDASQEQDELSEAEVVEESTVELVFSGDDNIEHHRAFLTTELVTVIVEGADVEVPAGDIDLGDLIRLDGVEYMVTAIGDNQ